MLTQERLKELLHYDPETGVFTWLESAGKKMNGRIAGTHASKNYISIGVSHKRYLAHRLAWLYVYGKFPDGILDHLHGGAPAVGGMGRNGRARAR